MVLAEFFFDYQIYISESNPSLIEDLIFICKSLDLVCHKKADKRKWSGFDGIIITGKNSILKFINAGGAITDVKISAKSNRFEGVKKRKVGEIIKKILIQNILPISISCKNYEEALACKTYLNREFEKLVKDSPDIAPWKKIISADCSGQALSPLVSKEARL